MRQNIGTRKRFEIFKRDGFTCSYCGRKPPSVVLQVDHVIPVRGGGTNDELNLVTACFDCNSGKGATPIGAFVAPNHTIVDDRQAQLDENRRRFELAKQQGRLIEEESEFQSEAHEYLSILWAKLEKDWNEKKGTYRIYAPVAEAILRFLRYLPPDEIADAIHKTFQKQPLLPDNRKARYFYSICWGKIKGEG